MVRDQRRLNCEQTVHAFLTFDDQQSPLRGLLAGKLAFNASSIASSGTGSQAGCLFDWLDIRSGTPYR
jgi:hypothetical protein